MSDENEVTPPSKKVSFKIPECLTFFATLGLILYAEPFSNYTANLISRFSKQDNSAIVKILNENVILTLAAQVMTIPLMAYYFNRISLISFVAITNHVFLGFFFNARKLPFAAGGETSAATSAQACIFHMLADLFGRIVQICITCGKIAVVTNVFSNVFRVDVSAILECGAFLQGIEGDVVCAVAVFACVLVKVQEALDHLAAHHGLFDDLFGIW